MSDDSAPLTHAQRGMLGGLAKVPKGFALPAVMAAALATRKANAEANAEAKRAVVKSITDRFDLTHNNPTGEHDHGSDQ
jgi:hydroxymethylpyrimidine/phosphomethylpyrimidine kinase